MGQCSTCCSSKEEQTSEIDASRPNQLENQQRMFAMTKIQSAIRTYLSSKRANEIYESAQRNMPVGALPENEVQYNGDDSG